MLHVTVSLPGSCHLPSFVFRTLPLSLPGGEHMGSGASPGCESWLWKELVSVQCFRAWQPDKEMRGASKHETTDFFPPSVLCRSASPYLVRVTEGDGEWEEEVSGPGPRTK